MSGADTAATGVERQTKKKGKQQQRTECTVNGSGQRQMSAEMLAAEMLAAEMSGDGGESRGSGGAIAAEQINSEWLL